MVSLGLRFAVGMAPQPSNLPGSASHLKLARHLFENLDVLIPGHNIFAAKIAVGIRVCHGLAFGKRCDERPGYDSFC